MLFSKRDLCKLIIPLVLQQILSTMTGTINSMMVSRAGDAAVSGISLVNTVDLLLIIIFTAVTTGGSVVVSQALGRKDQNLIHNSSKQLLYSITFIALIISVLTFTLRVPLLNLIYGDVEPDVMGHALNYFSFLTLSFPVLAIYSTSTVLFRVMGDTFTCMMLSLASNIQVIITNYLFISKMEMGAAGAGLSTLISRTLFGVISLILLHDKKRILHLEKLFHYRPDFSLIKRILQIGIPTGVENCLFQFGRLLTSALISTMGTVAVAANSVALTLANYQYMAGNAVGNAATTVVGRCIGANELRQAKRYSRILLATSYVLLISGALFTLFFAKPLLSLFSLSKESTDLAATLLRIHSIIAIFIWPLGFSLPSIFRATGDAKFPMKVASTAMWVFRVAGAYILASDGFTLLGLSIPGFGMGIIGVWIAMFADWVFRALFYGWKYFSGRWIKSIHET